MDDSNLIGKNGSTPSSLSPEDVHRFWDKVKLGPSDDCWTWTAYTDRDGYGRFSLKGKKLRAHRVAARIDGRDPTGEVVCHTCDNPSCVNPNHLKVGTQAENMRDRDRKGRHPRGVRNGRAKLSADEVRQIRQSNRPSTVLSEIYGVSPGHIRMIKTNQFWTHL